ncbi:hypothetical protein CL647_05545 [bacterium]|nr:hypothetical protein [Actinomycetota bacterium]MBE33548.1 hypothetical protein [bacterium]|tara:strand:+ start:10240 stop:10635 length:396 start_codon:yes stop_codon:yes gene_type:complete
MKRNLSLDHLNNASQYLSHLDEADPNDVAFSFLNYLAEAIPLDVLSVFITNYNLEPDANVLYILRLDREKIELYESNSNTENNICYQFSDDVITLNANPMSTIYKTAFKKRLNDIIKDLKFNKCEILEETL